MTRSRRVLKIAKWTAVVLFLLSLGVWVLAANWLTVIPLTPRDARDYRQALFIAYGAVGTGRDGSPNRFSAVNYFRTPKPWFRSLVTNKLSAPAWCLLAVAFPLTAALFYADRRRIPPGHCRCGYDLTGNVSGRCPECGTAIAK